MSTNPLETATQRAEAAFAALADHESSWGADESTIPQGQRERRARLRTAVANAVREGSETATRAEKLEALKEAAKDPRNRESGDVTNQWAPGNDAGFRMKANPWEADGDNFLRVDSAAGLRQRALDACEFGAGLPDHGRDLLTRTVETDDDAKASALILSGMDPEYRAAFTLWLSDPARGHLRWSERQRASYARVESARAALSTTDANGGFLIPFSLDPTVVLSNAGAINPFRQIARSAATVTGNWHGAASAGITSEWLAEGATAAAADPTFSRLTIPVHKASAWVSGSYEIFADSDLGAQLPVLLADSRDVLEAAAFATGSGSGAPKGVITAVAATTGSTVTSTTSGTFGLPDLFDTVAALPARARQGKRPAAVASLRAIQAMRGFDTAGGSSYWVTLGDGSPSKVLGFDLYESSAMSGAITTSGSKIAVFGDFDRFQIVDRLGMSLVIDPVVKDPTTGRPTGQQGVFAYWRTGSDVLDGTAFRVIQIK